MISEIQNQQITTNQQVFTSLQEHRQEQKELGQLVRLSLMNDKNKNPVYNQIRVGFGLPEVALGRPPKQIKDEDLSAGTPNQLPITEFSQRRPVLEDNYDVSRAKQMLDTLDANLQAEKSAKSGRVAQLEYTQPLLLKNETEMQDVIDTRPPSPVEVNMTAEVGRQLESPDTTLEPEFKRSKETE